MTTTLLGCNSSDVNNVIDDIKKFTDTIDGIVNNDMTELDISSLTTIQKQSYAKYLLISTRLLSILLIHV